MAYKGNDRARLTPLSRGLFAVTERFAYLNHAAVGVLPEPTRIALTRFIDAHATGGVARLASYELRMPSFRDAVAGFIGAQPGTIAFLRSTTEGATILAAGMPWRDGDEVILPDNEFPANALPWLALRPRGVNVRFIETARERLTADVLRRTITARTRAVAVSWVSFADGYRHNLPELAEVAHAHGALLFVDAIQGLGAFPLDVQTAGIDALYCGGAKWLLALQGVSFLYIAPGLLDTLHLALPGWRSVRDIWDFLNYDQGAAPDATRFEGGTPNFLGALSIAESLGVLSGPDPRAIERHVLGLTDHLVEGLSSMGAEIASIRQTGVRSGIVTFSLPGTDAVALGKALQRDGIVTTYRAGGIRVAPHGYNTHEEIDALVDAVRSYRKVTA